MKTKHTPGPWNRNIKPAKKYNTIFAGRNTHIARLATEGLTDEEIEANCDLITAAPDLLEILGRILQAHDSQHIPGATMGEAKLCPVYADMARHAIKKATGQ